MMLGLIGGDGLRTWARIELVDGFIGGHASHIGDPRSHRDDNESETTGRGEGRGECCDKLPDNKILYRAR